MTIVLKRMVDGFPRRNIRGMGALVVQLLNSQELRPDGIAHEKTFAGES